MKRRPKLSSVAFVALVFVLGADGILLLGRQRLWKRVIAAPKAQIWIPASAEIPSGYLADGLPYGAETTGARCFALLYTSANCGFCSAEMPAWRTLVAHSRALGCDAIRIPSYREAESPGDTEQTEGRQLVFLQPGWLMGNPPRQIPTLMIFARGAAEASCYVGRLDPAGAHSAESALSAAALVGAGGARTALKGTNHGGDEGDSTRLTCR